MNQLLRADQTPCFCFCIEVDRGDHYSFDGPNLSTQDLLAIRLAVLGQDNARLPQLARPVITMQGGVQWRNYSSLPPPVVILAPV